MSVPAIDLSKLKAVFAILRGQDVAYGLGAKAPSLHCDPAAIEEIDCSGLSRYLLYKSTGGELEIPDGSQNQREWAEESGLHKLTAYTNAGLYGHPNRLFMAFIRPFTNGCGKTGHVWFVTQFSEGNSVTIESHAGKGVDSRKYNTSILLQQVYSCYELPASSINKKDGE